MNLAQLSRNAFNGLANSCKPSSSPNQSLATEKLTNARELLEVDTDQLWKPRLGVCVAWVDLLSGRSVELGQLNSGQPC